MMENAEDRKVWSTEDMSLAAWMLSKGKKILSVKFSKGRDFCYVFSDEEESCGDMVVEFVNSEAHAFDQAIRTLKKLRALQR